MTEELQARKQHPVPQEVFAVKFKLVGDLTLRQFGVLVISGLIAFVIFSTGLFLPIRIILSVLFLLIGAGFAFVPIQDQPMDQWISAFFRAIYQPTRRLWVKSTEAPEFLTMEIPKLSYAPEPGVTADESRRRLRTFLSTIREEKLSPLDLEEKKTLESIRTLAREVIAPPTPAPTITVYPPEERPKAAPPIKPKAVVEKVENIPPLSPILPELRFIEVQRIQKRPALASQINWGGEKIYKVQRGEAASYFAARKNVRVGRRLSPLAISGEVVYAPARERVIEPELPQAPTLPQASTPQAVDTAPLTPLTPTALPAPPEEEIKIIPEELPKPGEEMPRPTPPALTKPKPEEKPEAEIEEAPKRKVPPVAIKKLPKLKPKRETPKEIGEANVISGVVHDVKGGVLEETLVVIKDSRGNVARAVKTNKLGRFTTTKLPNGSYSLELPKAPVPFATIKVELTGEEMEKLNIVPKV